MKASAQYLVQVSMTTLKAKNEVDSFIFPAICERKAIKWLADVLVVSLEALLKLRQDSKQPLFKPRDCQVKIKSVF